MSGCTIGVGMHRASWSSLAIIAAVAAMAPVACSSGSSDAVGSSATGGGSGSASVVETGGENGEAGGSPDGATGGGAGNPATVYRECETYGDIVWTAIDYTVQHTTHGSNGTFVDECDENGNLREYDCTSGCPEDPWSLCDYGMSGSVGVREINCEGRCVDGACPRTCVQDETITVLGVNADGTARFATNWNTELNCVAVFDRADDDYDCIASLPIGGTVEVLEYDIANCTLLEDVLFGMSDPAFADPNSEQCAYSCTAVLL